MSSPGPLAGLTLDELRRHGRAVLAISAAAVGATAAIVGGGLTATGTPVALSLLLAGVATATAPAAILDVVQESGADGPRTQTLLGVVAVDDAWGILLFSLLLAAAEVSMGGSGAGESLVRGTIEIGGAIAVGGAVFAARSWLRSEDGRRTYERWVIRTPVIGPQVANQIGGTC